MHLLSSILLAFSSSLDSLIIGIAYGTKKIKISFYINVIIAVIVTIGTFLSMYLGLFLAKLLPLSLCTYLGSFLLIAVGIWMIYDNFKDRSSKKNIDKNRELINSLNYEEIIKLDKTADINGSGKIELSEAITLALALSLNNLALGIGASISGINIAVVTIFTFIFSILTLLLGLKIGNSYISKLFGEYSPVLAAAIIIAMGVFPLI